MSNLNYKFLPGDLLLRAGYIGMHLHVSYLESKFWTSVNSVLVGADISLTSKSNCNNYKINNSSSLLFVDFCSFTAFYLFITF